MLCRGRKPVDVALEFKQRGFLEMLAAFISPPAPREQHHFDAILRLAVFFEDLSGVTDEALDRWIVRPRLNNLFL